MQLFLSPNPLCDLLKLRKRALRFLESPDPDCDFQTLWTRIVMFRISVSEFWLRIVIFVNFIRIAISKITIRHPAGNQLSAQIHLLLAISERSYCNLCLSNKQIISNAQFFKTQYHIYALLKPKLCNATIPHKHIF